MTANTESLPLFLGSVIAISLTGVMMPGPVTAVTVTREPSAEEPVRSLPWVTVLSKFP